MTASRAAHLFQRVRAEHEADDADLLARFAAGRDAAAFAALVRRHGPLVLGVCRRTLSLHDAEDAFQAVFLVLAQKAGRLRDTRLLSAWLYGVAWRTAKKAKRRAARRREEPRAVLPEPATADAAMSDLGPVLDEELATLPAVYREAILACDVGGLSRTDAAAKLGVPEGTLSSRLAAGRKKLADRLARRGVTLSLPVLATLTTAGVSDALVQQTLDMLSLWSAGGAVPKPIAELTPGGMTMVRNALLIAGSLLVAGAVGVGLADDPAKPPPNADARPAEAKADAKPTEVRYGVPKMKQAVELPMERIESLTWLPDGRQFALIGYGRISLNTKKGGPQYTNGSGVFFYSADPPVTTPTAVYYPGNGVTILNLTADCRSVATTSGSAGKINSQKRVWLVPVLDATGKPFQAYPLEGPNPRSTTNLPLEPEYGDVLGYTADGLTLATFQAAGEGKADAKLVLRVADDGTPKKTIPLGSARAVVPSADFTRLAYVAFEQKKSDAAMPMGFGPRPVYRGERIEVVVDGPKPTTWAAKYPDGLELQDLSFTADGGRLLAAYGSFAGRRGRGGEAGVGFGGMGAKPADDSVVVGYDAATGTERFRWASAARGLSMVRASFDGRLVAARETSADGHSAVVIVETAGGTLVKRWPLGAAAREGGQPRFLWAFSPTEPKLLVVEPGEGSSAVSVGLWEFPTK